MPKVNTPDLALLQPAQNSKVPRNASFFVGGAVSEAIHGEPPAITSVTVQVDSGPVVKATLRPDPHNLNKNLRKLLFQAAVQLAGGEDPHTVTVIATDDHLASTRATRTIFADVPFGVSAPALVIDIASLGVLDPTDPSTADSLRDLQKRLQSAVADFSQTLVDYHRMLAGPNLLVTSTAPSPATPFGSTAIRVGFWIEEYTFPVLPADPKHGFPLPLLPDKGAVAGFALVPPLPVPAPDATGIKFAAAVPVGALQRLADAVRPIMAGDAADQDVTLDSITARTSAADLTVEVHGSAQKGLTIPFTIKVSEVLGTKEIGQIGLADPTRSVPTVIRSSHDSSVDSLLDLIVSVVFPPFLVLLAGAAIKLTGAAGDSDTNTTASLKSTLEGVPSLIPFPTSKGTTFGKLPDFPRLVLSWSSFGTSDTGILGIGTATLDGRDASLVRVTLAGHTEISGTAADLTSDVPATFHLTLVNIAPDAKGLHWQVSGDGPRVTSGPANPGSLTGKGLEGKVKVQIPMPKQPIPGHAYHFKLTVHSVETCAIDPAKKISGSTTWPFKVVVNRTSTHPGDPPHLPQ